MGSFFFPLWAITPEMITLWKITTVCMAALNKCKDIFFFIFSINDTKELKWLPPYVCSISMQKNREAHGIREPEPLKASLCNCECSWNGNSQSIMFFYSLFCSPQNELVWNPQQASAWICTGNVSHFTQLWTSVAAQWKMATLQSVSDGGGPWSRHIHMDSGVVNSTLLREKRWMRHEVPAHVEKLHPTRISAAQWGKSMELRQTSTSPFCSLIHALSAVLYLTGEPNTAISLTLHRNGGGIQCSLLESPQRNDSTRTNWSLEYICRGLTNMFPAQLTWELMIYVKEGWQWSKRIAH